MKHQPTYLYQVKNSKNFYFRIRKNVFSEKFGYHPIKSEHFVASLKTSEYDEALWLSQFIFKKLRKEIIMENYNVVSQQLLVSQVKHLECINSLFDLSEHEFNMRLDAFLKERFNYWLSLGKKMLFVGVADPSMFKSLRTIPPNIFKQHYEIASDVEPHPSPDAQMIEPFCIEAKRMGIALDPKLHEAQMLNRLMAELSKEGKKYSQYSPDTFADITEFDASNDYEFLNLIRALKEFRNFGRKAERKIEVAKNRHLLLQTCISNFKKQKFTGLGRSGQQQYTTSLDLLFEEFGDEVLVTEFSGKEVVKFKNAVLDIDSGRKIAGVKQKLSIKSVNKYLSNVRQFFDWLVEVPKYLESNPFSGVSIKLENKHQKRRRKFSQDEIITLVNYRPTSIKEAKTIRNAARWFAPIALYTGMRLNEIASLALRDIRCSEGIEYIDLTDRKGKSKNAPRLIPISSKLLAMGFLDYVAIMKKENQSRLFPELSLDSATAKRDGCGSQIGNWFNDTMLSKIGIDKKVEYQDGIIVDFHCCRHTVASRLKYHGVDGYIAKQILGHDQSDEITWGTYSLREGTKLSALQIVVESIDY